MVFVGFALYLDMSPLGSTRPAYVLFGEAVVNMGEGPSNAMDKLLRGVYAPWEMPRERMRLFFWEVYDGAQGVMSVPLDGVTKLEQYDEDHSVLLTNYHFFIEQRKEISDDYPVWLDFGIPVKRHQALIALKKEVKMGQFDKDRLGVHQSVLGSATGGIPREYFYLRGEACFTQGWIESRWKTFLKMKDGQDSTHHQICALISTLTSHVNFWVTYVHDSIRLPGGDYDFELFSNRTMLTQSGDCEDVAAWLMSGLNRVKVNNWCGGCMKDHLAINLLLKVDNGAVEGHKPTAVNHDAIKKERETLGRKRDGNFHVPGLVVSEKYLRGLLKGEVITDTDALLAEGTALIYSVFTKHVPGLDNHAALKNMVNSHHLKDLTTFAAVGEATDKSRDIYHTLVEIMINPEMRSFVDSKFDSSIYLTCYRDENGKLSYPVTLADFVDPVPERKVFLEKLMDIDQEDVDIYDEIMSYEPPRLLFDDEVDCYEKEIPVGEVGLVSSDEDVGDIESLNMGVFKIVFGRD